MAHYPSGPEGKTGRGLVKRDAKRVDLDNKLHPSVYTVLLPGGCVFECFFVCVVDAHHTDSSLL